MSTTQKKTLGEILVAKGVITEDQLRQAQEVQKASPGDIGHIIVDLGFATEELVTLARAKELGLSFFDFKKHKVDPAAVRLVPDHIVKRYGILPVHRQDNKLYVAISDPKTSVVALDDIRNLLRAQNITPQQVLASKTDLDEAIANLANRNGSGGGASATPTAGGKMVQNVRPGSNKGAASGGSAVPALIKEDAATPAIVDDISSTPAGIDLDGAGAGANGANGASANGTHGANGTNGANGTGAPSGSDLASAIQGELMSITAGDDEDEEDLGDGADEAPIIRIGYTIIQQAIRDRASDIHIEPEKKGVRIRYRIDGVLNEIMTVPKHIQQPLISRYKLISEMNIAERRVPQDGRIPIRFEGKEYDLRVNAIPTSYGEKLVMRILDKGNVSLGIEQLGFAPDVRDDILEMTLQPNGMFLVTGPTGSGKTTTLNSILRQIATIEKNVCTAEDPVEYQVPGIAQVQMNKKAGLTFATALRAFLRQDPDIIMVGEMRDLETAQIAVEASLTGHLVLSTLHTNDAPSAIMRLSDMGVEPFLLSSTVIGVLAQRLARRICKNCKEAYEVEGSSLRRFGFVVDDENAPVVLHRGSGCDTCRGTGYKGRMGIYELFKINEELQDLIVRRAPLADLKAVAKANGMKELRDDGLRKVLLGDTTPDEVMRVVFTSGG
jgi:type IV pilus assembly protein PilB